MKYKLIFSFAMIFLSLNLFAQSTKSYHRIYTPLWFGSGYGFEGSVSNEMTINLSIDMRAYIGDDDFAADNFVVSPRITLEPRYYYNMKSRADKGKNTNYNSANYISIDFSYELPYGFDGIRDWPQNTIRILPTYGIRRSLSQNFTIDFGLYAGYKLKQYGDRNPQTGDWDFQPWTQHKFAYGINILLNHMF